MQGRSLGPRMLRFLEAAVRGRANVVVSGGTGSGKTTLLGVLSGFIPDGERLITIEDAAELRLAKPHVVALEARPDAKRDLGDARAQLVAAGQTGGRNTGIEKARRILKANPEAVLAPGGPDRQAAYRARQPKSHRARMLACRPSCRGPGSTLGSWP